MMRVETVSTTGTAAGSGVAPALSGGPAPDREVTHPTLTVVMPAYNEEEAIEAAVDDVRVHVLDVVPGSTLIVVNDGSRDGTGTILDAIAARDPRVRPVHQPNGGHGPALMTGMNRATTDYLFLLDSDRQITLDGFPAAWAHACARRDAVFGVRRHREDPALRLALTAVIRRSLRLMFGVSLHDANVPYKLVRRRVWEEARAIIPADTLAPSLFLATYLKARGHDVAEMEIAHRERETGVVSIRRWKLLRFCARGFRQLLRFRADLRRR